MRRWPLLVVALTGAWLGLSGAQLRFHPEPRLLGVFHLVVEGVAEEEGEAVLFNAVTGQRWVVPLKREGTVLKSPPIKVVRSCDQPESGLEVLVEVREPGELLVAATSLACGLSAAARVKPRNGPCTLTLEVRDKDEWKAAERLGAGEYRLRIVYPAADRTCERDPLPGGLKVRMVSANLEQELSSANFKRELPLLPEDVLEDEPTSGTFTWTFSTAFHLDEKNHAVVFRLLYDKEKPPLEGPAECATVIFSACDQNLERPVKTLVVTIKHGPTLLIPVGCRAKITLLEPKEPDKVRWWVPGRGWIENAVLEIEVNEAGAASLPQYPEAMLVRVFAQKGAEWGMNQIALSIMDRPKLRFVSAETGEEITDGCPFQQAFRIRVEGLRGWPEPSLTVHVGKLGPHPNERAVKLRQVSADVYESDPLSPRDWQAKAGEFLWAQLRFPEPIECVISVLLPLR